MIALITSSNSHRVRVAHDLAGRGDGYSRWDHSLSVAENHIAAAQKFLEGTGLRLVGSAPVQGEWVHLASED